MRAFILEKQSLAAEQSQYRGRGELKLFFPVLRLSADQETRASIAILPWAVTLIETPKGELVLGHLLEGAVLRVRLNDFDPVENSGHLTIKCGHQENAKVVCYWPKTTLRFRLNEPLVIPGKVFSAGQLQ